MAKRLRINERMIAAGDKLETKLAKQVHMSFRLRLSIEDVIRLMANVNLVDSMTLLDIPTNTVREAFNKGAKIAAEEL